MAVAAAVFVGYREGSATADGTGSTSGTLTALAASDFPIYLQRWDSSRQQWVDMNDTERLFFFNRAHCECNLDGTKEPGHGTGYVRISIRPPSTTWQKISAALTANSFSLGIGKVFVGGNTYNCLSPSTTYSLPSVCTNVTRVGSSYSYDESFSLSVFNTVGHFETDPIPVSAFFGAVSSATKSTCGANQSCMDVSACDASQSAAVIYLWAQTKAGTTPDFTEAPAKGSLNLVGRPAAGTTAQTTPSLKLSAGNEAIVATWEWPQGYSPATDSNVFGVQLFCQRAADMRVFPGVFTPAYQTAATLCKESAPATLSYGAFENLNREFLCSGLISPSTSSHRITKLQNGIYYGVGLAVIDKYYNVSPITPAQIQYEKPDPSIDFYTEYRDQGGSAEGGFCAIGRGSSRSDIAALLFVAGVVALVRRRRRSKGKASPSSGAILLFVTAGLLASNEANAQPVYHDGSLVQDQANERWRGTPRQFAIEARFGLYSPNVDSEISKGDKPHALIFGSKHRPMWQIEFDWQFLQQFGTLSVAGVVGYFKESAHACRAISLPACEKSPADYTSLRLIPLAALLVYRMDEAANRWNIPLVPYAKIGLNYTIWTITDGNGDVPDYGAHGRGQGGTMGWQAALGISLRLDFLDPGAARGFDADAGVNHSYAFFELDHIDGSGLYRKDVLRVGDNTWFAGLMFEF